MAVAKAAMDSGVARKPIKDFEKYENELASRLDQSMNFMRAINSAIKGKAKRVVFAEGEDPETLKAAVAFKNSGLGEPILIANKEKLKETFKQIGLDENYNMKFQTLRIKKKAKNMLSFYTTSFNAKAF